MSGTLKDINLGRSDVWRVAPQELMQKPGWNSRNMNDPENREHIEGLKKSIKAIGVQTPLTVFREDDKYYISDGNCRHTAVLDLLADGVEIKSVPVITEPKSGNAADALLRQALEGKPKTALELRTIFKQLIGYGWTEEEIAEKSGKGLQSVRMALELEGAPMPIKQMVDAGRISPTLAIQTLKKEGSKAVKVLSNAVDAAIQEGKTHATAQHIGAEPSAPRKARLTQVQEMVEKWEWNEEDESFCTVTISDTERAQLFKLLDI